MMLECSRTPAVPLCQPVGVSAMGGGQGTGECCSLASCSGSQILLLPRQRRETDLLARDFLFIVSQRWVPQKHGEEDTDGPVSPVALGGCAMGRTSFQWTLALHNLGNHYTAGPAKCASSIPHPHLLCWCSYGDPG